MRTHPQARSGRVLRASCLVVASIFLAPSAAAEIADLTSLPAGAHYRGMTTYENDGWKPLINARRVYHCAGYGCRNRKQFTFSTNDLMELAIIMSDALVEPGAKSERAALANAVAWMERRVGRALGTDRDRASIGFLSAGQKGQQDCVDEARNTAAYISVLHANGLIGFHKRPIIVNRGNILSGAFPHYGVVIKERHTKRLWAVDSGVGRNGAKPRIETARRWFARGRSRVPRGL